MVVFPLVLPAEPSKNQVAPKTQPSGSPLKWDCVLPPQNKCHGSSLVNVRSTGSQHLGVTCRKTGHSQQNKLELAGFDFVPDETFRLWSLSQNQGAPQWIIFPSNQPKKVCPQEGDTPMLESVRISVKQGHGRALSAGLLVEDMYLKLGEHPKKWLASFRFPSKTNRKGTP